VSRPRSRPAPVSGRGRLVLDAVLAYRRIERFPGAAATFASCLDALTDTERQWVAELDRSGRAGALVELVEAHFGPIDAAAP
jgi:hypothetical protein